MITAAAADEHSIKTFDATSGQYKGTLYVTSGKIIGQPLVNSDTISITYQEGSHTYLGIYSHKLHFKSKILIS